ncbi:MAG: hypothetical protein NC401_04050 [Ruminococcus sp.]|nr:hypothetical protein [Ruminococcus sp.]
MTNGQYNTIKRIINHEMSEDDAVILGKRIMVASRVASALYTDSTKHVGGLVYADESAKEERCKRIAETALDIADEIIFQAVTRNQKNALNNE